MVIILIFMTTCFGATPSKTNIGSDGFYPYTCLFLNHRSMALNFNVSNLSIAQLEQQKAICDQRIHQLETLTVQLLPYKHLDSHKQLWNQTQQQLFTIKVHREAVINRLLELI